jgi:hypothetical protein
MKGQTHMHTERKLLLVSFHRNHALHQKIAIVDAWRTAHQLPKMNVGAILKKPAKLENYLEYRFLYKEFSHADMDASAQERLQALDKEVPGWIDWPIVFEAPGLPAADSALERAFRQRIAGAADPSQTEVRRARLMPLLDAEGAYVEPVVFVVSSISDPLTAQAPQRQREGLAPDRELIKECLPDTLLLLDLGLQPMTDKMVANLPLPHHYKQVLHLKAGEWDREDGQEPASFPDVNDRAPAAYMEKIGEWLENHPQTKGREWGNEPLALAWFGATWNQAMAAATYLHSRSGGFPSFVFFLYKGVGAHGDLRSYDPILVGARSMRQYCHPTEADARGQVTAEPKSPPASVEPRTTAASVAWLVHRWPRWLGHRRSSTTTIPCAECLELPLDADRHKLRDVLEPAVYRQFSNLCGHVDGSALNTVEWKAACAAAHSYSCAVAAEYGNSPLWCQQVQVTLKSLSDGKAQVRSDCLNSQCCPEIILQRDSLRKVVTLQGLMEDVIRDAEEYGGRSCCMTCRCDEDHLYLGLAHDGTALSEDDLEKICEHPKGGVKARLSFAKDHLAHLRLFWVDDAGQCWSVFRDGGQWEMGDQGVVATQQPATDWAEKAKVRKSPLPKGFTTMWQFELPLTILRVPRPEKSAPEL